MTLTPLEILLETNGIKKTALISIDNGLYISGKDDDLTLDEIHFLTSIAFIYIGAHRKDAILDPQTIVDKGIRLYTAFYKKYKGIKSITDMSLDEFNKEMKKYNGRSKK